MYACFSNVMFTLNVYPKALYYVLLRVSTGTIYRNLYDLVRSAAYFNAWKMPQTLARSIGCSIFTGGVGCEKVSSKANKLSGQLHVTSPYRTFGPPLSFLLNRFNPVLDILDPAPLSVIINYIFRK